MTALLINASPVPGQDAILTAPALAFIAALEEKFGERRRSLLEERAAFQRKLDGGYFPDFPEDTAAIRAASWLVRSPPPDLEDRRVEITGPADRKTVINALNSGANVFMADLEDSQTPTWENQINGQINLRDANRRTISFTDPVTEKNYELNKSVAVLLMRPRGWHMEEKHVTFGGRFISASIFDLGLYLFHNRSKPYFYLPKLEGHREARLWSDILSHAEDVLGLARGTIRVTVLIETITAAFEMDEILYELRDHITGLNCGRWDYIFNFIKRFSTRPDFIMPDRSALTMDCHFLNSYSLHLIKTCHRRGAHAMGGMAAQIPVKNDEQANREALNKLIADKEREARNGHDGTWVAHPALVGPARAVFDRYMKGANQKDKPLDDVNVKAADLLTIPAGLPSAEGVHKNIRISLLYIQSWLSGTGCVPINHLMEDAATAEISRAQLWQWRRHRVRLQDGRVMDDALMDLMVKEEVARLSKEEGADFYLEDAARLLRALVMQDALEEFLTTPAYEILLAYERGMGLGGLKRTGSEN